VPTITIRVGTDHEQIGMADRAPVPSDASLLSHYKIGREADGELVLKMPWPGRPLVGCAIPVAIVSIGALLIGRFGNGATGLYGMSVMACLFAAVVIPIVIYQGTHAWALRRGLIRHVRTLGPRHWCESEWQEAQSVLLKREIWPDRRGSTDSLLVVTDGGAPLRVVGVYNWDGAESRLASGGKGSLARSGPTVPTAPAPLTAVSEANLESSVSEAVREMADLVVRELGVPFTYVCGYARQSPDDTS
jgi:hypothetical protein